MAVLYREIPVETFAREWRGIHDLVFNGNPADEQPFLNPLWDRFLVSYGLHIDSGVFDALVRAGRQTGDEEAVIWNSAALEPQPAASIPWSYQALDQVRCTALSHFETHIFGRSGSWGVVCTVDDFSCVGGAPNFMDGVVASLGGREAIKDRFLRFAKSGVRQTLLTFWTPCLTRVTCATHPRLRQRREYSVTIGVD